MISPMVIPPIFNTFIIHFSTLRISINVSTNGMIYVERVDKAHSAKCLTFRGNLNYGSLDIAR